MYLRSYRAEDLEALHALDVVCFKPPFRFSRRAMRRFAEMTGAIVRLACERTEADAPEQLRGFSIVQMERGAAGKYGYVVTLNVHPEHRRRGLGRLLMSAVEDCAIEAGALRMALHVFAGNRAAIALYERLGYRFVRAERSFYGRGLDALIYRKRLAAGSAEAASGSAASSDAS